MHVRPRPGFLIRDPRNYAHLPPEGAEVPEVTYWRRRIIKRDVEIFVPNAGKSSKPKED